MERCPMCARDVAPGSRYCPYCGAALAGEDAGAPASPWDTGRRVDPALFARLSSRDYPVRGGDWIRRGWALFLENPGAFLGFTALAFAVSGALAGVPVVGGVLSLASGPLWAGGYVVACRMLTGRRTEFADFFGGFRFFLPVLLAALLTTLFVAAGTLLLVLPGIYLAVGYVFAVLLILDRRMDFWQAMELSRRTVTRRWFPIAGFLLLLLLLNVLGAILLLVGLLVTVPVTFCALAAAYDDVFGIESGGP